MPHLRHLTHNPAPDAAAFPLTIPALRDLTLLDLSAPVTFFIGENGSGKSTLLEALALAARLPTVGSERVEADATLKALRPFADRLKLVWNKKAVRGFFLRAEDFFGYAKRQMEMKAEMEREASEITADYERRGRSKAALGLALMSFRGELADMKRRYGEGLDAQSHGESFSSCSVTASSPTACICWMSRKRRSPRCGRWRCLP